MAIENLAAQQQTGTRPLLRSLVPTGSLSPALQTELVRKSLHMLIAVVPLLASAIGSGPALSFLAAGTLFYTYAESLRGRGGSVFIVSRVTVLASRERDSGFVLGPVTLGIGAMLALLLYPAPAASLAIYALAFGDGLSSLVGRSLGTVRIPGTGGKTLEGSLAGFAAVFAVAVAVSGVVWVAFVVALAAMLIELLPAGDADNIVLPTFVGLVATQLPI